VFELKTFEEIGDKAWNQFVLSTPNGSIHQISQWKKLQESVPTRGKVRGWAALKAGEINACSLVVRMKTGVGNTEWYYAGRGPVFTDAKAAEFLLGAISSQLREQTSALFLRFDPYILAHEKPLAIHEYSAKPATQNYHPPDTIILDLSQGSTAILNGLKKKRRYDIRKALKSFQIEVIAAKNVKPQDIDDFYHLLTSTADQNKFSPHSKKYYADFLRELSDYATLWFARDGKNRVATSILTVCEDKALYYFAALTTDDAIRKNNPSHAIVWKQIEYAAERKATTFDLLGVAPTDAKPSHPYAGITVFKEGFGGQRISYQPGVEISLHPFSHSLYRFAKKVKR
jgi:lipid II:glycine glycyltransferase (peptidoglycan interpeptide bridge formation enzyme)